jgi:integrase
MGYICHTVNWKDLTLPEDRYGEGRSFTAEQGKQIIAAAEMPFRLMFALAAYCGLRAGEILGLRAEDIDLERRILRVTQTSWHGKIQSAKTAGSETSLPLPEILCELLRKNLPTSGLLFINQHGQPFTGELILKKQRNNSIQS